MTNMLTQWVLGAMGALRAEPPKGSGAATVVLMTMRCCSRRPRVIPLWPSKSAVTLGAGRRSRPFAAAAAQKPEADEGVRFSQETTRP